MVPIGLGEYAICRHTSEILVAYGLGSCLGIGMYDPENRIAGLLHAVLPSRANSSAPQSRFVDSGIPLLVEEMLAAGSRTKHLRTYLVGGANMLPREGEGMETLRIGDRNIAAAREVLAQLGLSITAEDVGGTQGRTVRLYVESGDLTLRTLGNREVPITKCFHCASGSFM